MTIRDTVERDGRMMETTENGWRYPPSFNHLMCKALSSLHLRTFLEALVRINSKQWSTHEAMDELDREVDGVGNMLGSRFFSASHFLGMVLNSEAATGFTSSKGPSLKNTKHMLDSAGDNDMTLAQAGSVFRSLVKYYENNTKLCGGKKLENVIW